MKEEVNLGSRHRNQYIEKAKRRSDQPSEHRSINKLCCAETELLNTDSSRKQ